MSEKIEDLFMCCRALAMPKAAYVFHRDDPVKRLYFVVKGSVELRRSQEDGSEIVLQRARAGDVLAEASLYSTTYHCDAVVTDDAELRATSKPNFIRQLRTDPELSTEWAAHLAREIQSTRAQVDILSRKTVVERLDGWLAMQGGSFPAKGTWRGLAQQIGVSPEALYREIARRRQERG